MDETGQGEFACRRHDEVYVCPHRSATQSCSVVYRTVHRLSAQLINIRAAAEVIWIAIFRTAYENTQEGRQ